MPTIPENVKKAIEAQDYFAVATSTADGVPNVAYVKYLKVIEGDKILIGDNYFAKTRENILNNKKVAFAVLDEEKGSFQIKGTATRLTEGKWFDYVQTWVSEKLPRAAAVIVEVENIYNGAEIIC
ncbi:MAG: pyridoxamine 5'-phosphate oxidase family protein [Sedimentisphaeraceae bacterium JB056]